MNFLKQKKPEFVNFPGFQDVYYTQIDTMGTKMW